MTTSDFDDYEAPFFNSDELDLTERIKCKSCGTNWVFCEEHDEWLGDRRGVYTVHGASPVHGRYCPDCWRMYAGYDDLKCSINEVEENRLKTGLERVISDVLYGKVINEPMSIPVLE